MCFRINSVKQDDESVVKEYELVLKLPYGKYKLNYNNSEIIIDYRVDDTVVATKIPTTLSLLYISGKSKELFLEFIESARKYCEVPPKEVTKDFTSIYQFDLSYVRWTRLSQLKKRPIDSIYLDKIQLDHLKTDLDDFMNSEEIYNKYGIPIKEITIIWFTRDW